MTVELICGRFTAEEVGGAVKIVADFVRNDDLSITGNELDGETMNDIPIDQIKEFLGKISKKSLILALQESYDIEDLIDVDFEPDVSWRRR